LLLSFFCCGALTAAVAWRGTSVSARAADML
jgi:hypothetical protein